MIDLCRECEGLPVREYRQGDVVIKEGARSGALFFLKSGRVEIVRQGVPIASEDEVGSVMGEISILLDRPHNADVMATEKVEFYVAEDAETFLKEHPEVNLQIARSLAKKVDAMGSYLADLKQQYADESSHLGLVHEVLDSLMGMK